LLLPKPYQVMLWKNVHDKLSTDVSPMSISCLPCPNLFFRRQRNAAPLSLAEIADHAR